MIYTGMSHSQALAHIGVLRKSGRYPWGSGEEPNQRNKQFIDHIAMLRKSGMTSVDIAKSFSSPDNIMTTTDLRAYNSIARNQLKAADISTAMKLHNTQMSNIAIGREMGINESQVRALLAPSAKENNDKLVATANMLREQVQTKKYLDIGLGTENSIGVGISGTALNTAVAQLKDEGYQVHRINQPRLGTGKETRIKVLVGPDTTFTDLIRNKADIKPIDDQYSDDGGRSWLGLRPPENVSSKRLSIRYAEDDGDKMDGVMEMRRGVKDLDLGHTRYAQVRIAIDGTHYLKGMAVYADDLPDGIDIRFNTNKNKDVDKMDVIKPMKKVPNSDKIDMDNPFGSQIKVGGQRGALNIVNEEGDWDTWSKNLSSQMVSKQSPVFAKQQLGVTFDTKKAEYDEIMALTNPTIRKRLLDSFADDADSSAVHLKAAGLPRTKAHVILPIPSMKDSEIYAPLYNDGERVVLIRHPHGGVFEIPELTVNNRNRKAKALLGQAKDAVGISAKVAEKLSGADFDGDTVLVIPNKGSGPSRIKTEPTLEALKNFQPREQYKQYDGMKLMTSRSTQTEMGNISNLITDMTIRGATTNEKARAVKHSMVVIDAEKHKLNYKQSAIDNNIIELKRKYQQTARGGASTLISKASSEERVAARKNRPVAEGGNIDPLTGAKKYTPTGKYYIAPESSKTNAKGVVKITPAHIVMNSLKSTKMYETDDAYTLLSGPNKEGTPMEAVYADHANKLKALGNTARKSSYETVRIPYSTSARLAYKEQEATLKAKLNVALKNAPLERQAQLVASTIVSAKKQANPGMDKDDIKKANSMALIEARHRTGASKTRIVVTPIEWEAIQSGAITNNFMDNIIKNMDVSEIKALATPRDRSVMTPSVMAHATLLLSRGYTQAEVSEQLGVPASTLNAALE